MMCPLFSLHSICLLFAKLFAGFFAEYNAEKNGICASGGGSTTIAPVHDGYVLQKVLLFAWSSGICYLQIIALAMVSVIKFSIINQSISVLHFVHVCNFILFLILLKYLNLNH